MLLHQSGNDSRQNALALEMKLRAARRRKRSSRSRKGRAIAIRNVHVVKVGKRVDGRVRAQRPHTVTHHNTFGEQRRRTQPRLGPRRAQLFIVAPAAAFKEDDPRGRRGGALLNVKATRRAVQAKRTTRLRQKR